MGKFLTRKNNIGLPVVSDKWQLPRPYDQRLCEECDMLGDDYQFVFLCKRLKVFQIKIC